MKKILILLMAFVAFAISSQAQVVDGGNADTLTNADTGSFVKKANTDSYLLYSVQPVINRLSGTLAGTVVLYGSNDGVNYIGTDTLTLSNVVLYSSAIYPVTKQWKYYKARFVTTGTVSARIKVYFYYKNN